MPSIGCLHDDGATEQYVGLGVPRGQGEQSIVWEELREEEEGGESRRTKGEDERREERAEERGEERGHER